MKNSFFRHFSIKIIVLSLGLGVAACASFYQLNYEFNRNFEIGDFAEAEKIIKEDRKGEKGNSRLLHFLNLGVVTAMQGKFEESNRHFEKAYLFGEDYQKNYLSIAASMLTNPTVVAYRGEDHEHLMLLYFKALNYLMLGNREAALIECRRLNLRLQNLSDRYQANFKYKEDAFALNLMGIIYDAEGDYNNAFIAYKNALEAYENTYLPQFGISTPVQLQEDLMHAAYRMNFLEDLKMYEQKFGRKFQPRRGTNGDLVMFWNNGLGPVKAEWSINMAVIRGSGGYVNFVNEEFGIDFPFNISDQQNASGGLGDLKAFRVAFPKYVERPVQFQSAVLETNRDKYPLDVSQNINSIAFKLLEQRMIAEFSKSLLRFALKKAAEQGLRSENEGMGALLGLVNAATEKADTRNWQTLPHSIHYTRVPLSEGQNQLTLKLYEDNQSVAAQSHEFTFDAMPGTTQFHSFHSLEVSPKYFSRGY